MTSPAIGDDAVRRLPKAELHVHLEGTVDARALRVLRGGLRAADPRFLEGGFPDFLEHYRSVLDLLEAPEDYGRLAALYLDSAPEHGARHVELTVSLCSALRRGHDPGRLLESIQAAADARRDHVRASVIVDTVRQFGPDEAMRTLEATLPHLHLGLVAGFGMGGDELAVPASAFRGVFQRAREHGLRTTVHAGETGDAASIRDALEELHPERIAHGIGAVADPALLERLAETGTPLDVCPTSNLATGVVARPEDHPLPVLLRAGVIVTLSTDDPGMFGTDLTREYLLAARIAGLDLDALGRLARNSLEAAFPIPS